MRSKLYNLIYDVIDNIKNKLHPHADNRIFQPNEVDLSNVEEVHEIDIILSPFNTNIEDLIFISNYVGESLEFQINKIYLQNELLRHNTLQAQTVYANPTDIKPVVSEVDEPLEPNAKTDQKPKTNEIPKRTEMPNHTLRTVTPNRQTVKPIKGFVRQPFTVPNVPKHSSIIQAAQHKPQAKHDVHANIEPNDDFNTNIDLEDIETLDNENIKTNIDSLDADTKEQLQSQKRFSEQQTITNIANRNTAINKIAADEITENTKNLNKHSFDHHQKHDLDGLDSIAAAIGVIDLGILGRDAAKLQKDQTPTANQQPLFVDEKWIDLVEADLKKLEEKHTKPSKKAPEPKKEQQYDNDFDD